jgi:hypothetical protein
MGVRSKPSGCSNSVFHNAKLGREEEMQAVKRSDDQAQRIELTAHGPSPESFIAHERVASPDFDGRSVFGREHDIALAKKIKRP